METYSEWLERIKKEMQPTLDAGKVHMNPSQRELLPTVAMYQQEKMHKQTKRLTWATWALARVTIILALITYFKP